MLGPTPFTPDHDRYFYEPRAFWSVGYGQPSTAGRQRTIFFPQADFLNGSRFPIRLTKLCMSPVGYLAKSFTATQPSEYDACMAGISRAALSIEYPRGYSGQRRPGPINLYGSDPTGDPPPATAAAYASSLFGVSRWDFDLPYFVAQKYALALDISAVRTYQNVAITAYRTWRAVYERTRSLSLGHVTQHFGVIRTAPLGAGFPAGPQPFNAPDNAVFPGLAGNAQQGWPGPGVFPGKEFDRQRANRGLPYTEVTGFGVFLDQRQFDDEVSADYFATFPDLVLAPLSQRIATKCRTNGGGTGEKWWRDGAPLSLVTPSITQAFVRTLEDPIVLQPGESIQVSLQLPPTRVVDDTTVDPIFSVGVSFTGYAVVEDNNRKIPPQPEFLPMPMTDT